jgi:DNA-binding response OmpR family regulator
MAAAALRVETVPRILVVDDEDAVCDLVSDILEDAGFEVHCVQSDRGAYAALAGVIRYSALVVDVNLGPGTTGFDVARFARQLRPTLPVLYVSGDSSEESLRAFGVPGSAFVMKPFGPDELAAQVRRLTDDNEA